LKITALEEYGLRCVLRLAMAPEGEPVTVGEIAEREGLTVPYVGKMMAVLRQSGLVESVRGRSGGYVLTRPAAEISVEETLGALGEPLFSSGYCESHPGALNVCSHTGNCSIRSVWQVLGDVIHQVLKSTTLADLCLQEERLASHFKDTLEPVLLHLGSGAGGGAASGGAPPPRTE
jgi:Rrf2 family iron-sulfur cluster assembly transcriptional regulator